MCEIFVSIFEFVISILILKNCCLFINIGFLVFVIVKCLKCFIGLLFENELDLEEY